MAHSISRKYKKKKNPCVLVSHVKVMMRRLESVLLAQDEENLIPNELAEPLLEPIENKTGLLLRTMITNPSKVACDLKKRMLRTFVLPKQKVVG